MLFFRQESKIIELLSQRLLSLQQRSLKETIFHTTKAFIFVFTKISATRKLKTPQNINFINLR